MNATSIPAADDLARRYGAAWQAHDLDKVMSMQTPEMQFELKLTGYPPTHGAAEVAEQFRFLFVSWPDMHFATQARNIAGLLRLPVSLHGDPRGRVSDRRAGGRARWPEARSRRRRCDHD
jgi:hypothetical protein